LVNTPGKEACPPIMEYVNSGWNDTFDDIGAEIQRPPTAPYLQASEVEAVGVPLPNLILELFTPAFKPPALVQYVPGFFCASAFKKIIPERISNKLFFIQTDFLFLINRGTKVLL